MAKKEEKRMNAKQKAYAQKQEKEGRKVVNWIFGGLIVLAIIYVCWTFYMMS